MGQQLPVGEELQLCVRKSHDCAVRHQSLCMQLGGWEMMLHHWAAFLSVIAAAISHQAHQYTLLLLFTELTTPFINARWVFDKLVSILLPATAVHWLGQAADLYAKITSR